jgi:hypothetical protein
VHQAYDNSSNEAGHSGGPLPVDEHAENVQARHQAFERFRSEFSVNQQYGNISTTVENPRGGIDRIELYARPSSPKIIAMDLDAEAPIRFEPTTYTLEFRRYRSPTPAPTKSQPEDLDFQLFDFSEEETPSAAELEEERINQVEHSPERIEADLREKFAGLGLPGIPISTYALRLSKETDGPQASAAYVKANLILPLYRSLETKRILADPASADSNYLEIAARRQHVYNQLSDLLREARMSPAEMTEYMMEGLYDGRHIAGVPVFEDRRGNTYVVVNYTFGGYDELHPEGTDFFGSYSRRKNLDQVLDRAEALGYTTHHEDSGVSGGTHQHWNWFGIKIEGYDRDSPESNLPKVLKILHDVGIDPEESVSTVDPKEELELYMRNRGRG